MLNIQQLTSEFKAHRTSYNFARREIQKFQKCGLESGFYSLIVQLNASKNCMDAINARLENAGLSPLPYKRFTA